MMSTNKSTEGMPVSGTKPASAGAKEEAAETKPADEQVTTPIVETDDSGDDKNASAEVAGRTVDTEAKTAKRFKKVFAGGFHVDGFDKDTYNHDANATSTITDCVNLGLRPVGDVKFESAKENPQAPETSTYLTYSVEALPAHDVQVVVNPTMVPVK